MTNELAPEDSLRLNVLMAADPVLAVRIDEAAMTLHALTAGGEARVRLHPRGRPDQYLARVREFLGGHALDSPGGYPVYLQRWTRMGQTSDRNLEALLRLGEPEAVVAVAQAPGLTDELAQRVWWCQPTMEIARWMLDKDAVVHGAMGKVLADFLVEHLPFEEDPDARLQTIRLVLHGRLVDDATVARLWRQARGTPYYYVGFLESRPDDLPADRPARADHAEVAIAVQALVDGGNAWAERYLSLLTPNGQTWLHAVAEVLARPATPAILRALLDAVGRRFRIIGESMRRDRFEDLQAAAHALAHGKAEAPPDLQALIAAQPHAREGIEAMLLLASLTRDVADPWLVRNTAVGALMRRKLDPLAAPIAQALERLRTPEPRP